MASVGGCRMSCHNLLFQFGGLGPPDFRASPLIDGWRKATQRFSERPDFTFASRRGPSECVACSGPFIKLFPVASVRRKSPTNLSGVV
ncbi:hypothetical protein EVAR_2298_1 [Eumeta japonica]|uniref:Uncharacterized protein n=1 Tax=Eumeta variegata TaxID=151549 RepID=A0A4C1SIQ8_EUMVA|nr:hypothetical protein EVAR_2298_1 [Eumeta japonica]